jgi:hypothetical protein
MRDRRILVLLGVAAVAIALFVVLRPNGDDDETAAQPTQTTTTEPAPATTAAVTATPATTTRPRPRPPAAETIRIAVRDGRVVGGIRRATIERGRRVVLVVTADVSDHVHLHGYDVMRDVRPGVTARLPFRATVPGRFEVELEDRRLQIAELTVRP